MVPGGNRSTFRYRLIPLATLEIPRLSDGSDSRETEQLLTQRFHSLLDCLIDQSFVLNRVMPGFLPLKKAAV